MLGRLSGNEQGVGSVTNVANCTLPYTVKSGDSCGSIATANGVYTNQVKGLNPTVNDQCSNMMVGESLCLNDGSLTCDKQAVVETGDSCASIAYAANISVSALQYINPYLDPSCTEIYPGDSLCVDSSMLANYTDSAPTPPPSSMPSVDTICVKNITLTTEASCLDVVTQYNVSSITLKSLNPTLNCSDSIPTHTSLCVAEMPGGCTKSVLSSQNQTCADIAARNNIPLNHFTAINAGVNCYDSIPAGTPMCVSDPFEGCLDYKAITSSDTCTSLTAINSLSVNDFQALNPSIDCSSLATSSEVCVLGKFSNCQQTYVTQVAETCTSVVDKFRTLADVQQFAEMNPWLNCNETLPTYSVVCVQSKAGNSCGQITKVTSDDTCSSIAMANDLSTFALEQLNPQLMCDELTSGQDICVDPPPTSCNSFYYIQASTNCTAIATGSNITMDQLNFYNPTLNCSNVNVGQVVCTGINPLSSVNLQFLSTIVPAVSKGNSNITAQYNEYLINPTSQALDTLNNEILAVTAGNNGLSIISGLIASSNYFRAYDTMIAANRSIMCIEAGALLPGSDAQTCLCGSESTYPYTYCSAVFQVELEQFIKNGSKLTKSQANLAALAATLKLPSTSSSHTSSVSSKALSMAQSSPTSTSVQSSQFSTAALKTKSVHNAGVSSAVIRSNKPTSTSTTMPLKVVSNLATSSAHKTDAAGVPDFTHGVSSSTSTLMQIEKTTTSKHSPEPTSILHRKLERRQSGAFILCGPGVPWKGTMIPDATGVQACLLSGCVLEFEQWSVTVTSDVCYTYSGLPTSNSQDATLSIPATMCAVDQSFTSTLDEFALPICYTVTGQYTISLGQLNFELDSSTLNSVPVEGKINVVAGDTYPLVCQSAVFQCAVFACYWARGQYVESATVSVVIYPWDGTGNQDVYNYQGSLPVCSAASLTNAPTSAVPPSSTNGKVVGIYYPNWSFYHTDGNEFPAFADQAMSQLTHINYAFATISYSQELDVFYADLTGK
ncbi:unnamed protein product [Umbelopsis sp. WA50703]